ncbi:ArsR/SmtB family transcription factor [Streptomyces sp. NPDC003691]
MSEVLSALADPTRRRILDALAARGSATATVLAAELPVSRQAIVKHLGVLDRAGLVSARRTGRETRFTVLPGRLTTAAHWMTRVAADWDTRLTSIKRLAESPTPRNPPPPGTG